MMKSLLLLLFATLLSTVYCQQNVSSGSCKDQVKKGDVAFSKARFDEAIVHYRKALDCSVQRGDESNQGKIHEKIGNSYASVNENVKAMDHFLKALKIAELSHNNLSKVQVNLSIASLKMRMLKYDDALKYLKRTNELYAANSELPLSYKREQFQMMGVVYGSIGKLDSARLYFEQCSALYQKNEKDENYGGILNNIGAIYSKQGNDSMALMNYQKALLFFNKINSEIGVAVTKGNIAYLYQKEKKYNDAIQLYDEAIGIFKKHKIYHYLSNNYLNLSDLYKDKGDFKTALKYHELYLSSEELTKNANDEALIESLEMQHMISEKDQEIKIIEQENQLKENRQNITIIILTSAMVLIILVYFNLRATYQKTQLKKELAEKEREHYSREVLLKEKDLEIFALKIIEKNKFLDELKGNLNEIQRNDEYTSKIHSLKHEISHNINLDKDRLEFEFQIDQLQKSFNQKLELVHKDLTKNEKRLCSLLLMDLSSKDMAIIMNITEESIKKNRHRLRKKLGLDAGSNLTAYLKSL